MSFYTACIRRIPEMLIAGSNHEGTLSSHQSMTPLWAAHGHKVNVCHKWSISPSFQVEVVGESSHSFVQILADLGISFRGRVPEAEALAGELELSDGFLRVLSELFDGVDTVSP